MLDKKFQLNSPSRHPFSHSNHYFFHFLLALHLENALNWINIFPFDFLPFERRIIKIWFVIFVLQLLVMKIMLNREDESQLMFSKPIIFVLGSRPIRKVQLCHSGQFIEFPVQRLTIIDERLKLLANHCWLRSQWQYDWLSCARLNKNQSILILLPFNFLSFYIWFGRSYFGEGISSELYCRTSSLK